MRFHLLLLLSLAGACRSSSNDRDSYVGGGIIALPQLGPVVSAGHRVRRPHQWDTYLEAEAAYQFIDDKDLADDGFPGAGSVTQFRLGLKHVLAPEAKRRLTFRWGAVWFQSTGEAVLIDRAGRYAGAYLSFGFETDLSERWSMGPDIRALFVEGTGSADFEVVPQFAWQLVFRY